jgi:hypothetical protein
MAVVSGNQSQNVGILSYLPLFSSYLDGFDTNEKKAEFLTALPLCAQEEMLDAEGLRYDASKLENKSYGFRCFHTVLKKEPKQISLEQLSSSSCTVNDFRDIARFVNSTTRFQRTPLLSAFKHLQGFLETTRSRRRSSFLPEPRTLLPVFFGRPTNKRPRSLGPCILSRYALDNRIRITPDTTFQDLCNTFLLCAMTTDEIQRMLSCLSKSDLLEALTAGMKNDKVSSLLSTPCALNRNKLENKIRISMNKDITSTQSNEEVVARAAKEFGVDVSPSPCPHLEYWQLSRCSTCNEEYFPLSVALQSLYDEDFKENSSVRIHERFNPLFRTLYTQAQLRSFALFEGYSEDEVQEHDAENLLLSLRKQQNIFRGKKHCSNTLTPVLFDNISECNPESCVTFFIPASDETMQSSFVATTFDEIALVFRQYQSFVNPADNYSPLSKRIVNKLSNIAQLSASGSTLIESIRQVRVVLDKSAQTTRNFVAAYSELDEQGKKSVRDALRSITELAMYMRGWSGEGEYPLENTQSDMEVVEARVVEELVRTKQALEVCSIKQHILSLPLVAYDNIRGEWKTSTDTEAGRTIGERLDIVSGQSDTNIHSCIRSSSNWLASSAHLYMRMVADETLFDISRLRTIA